MSRSESVSLVGSRAVIIASFVDPESGQGETPSSEGAFLLWCFQFVVGGTVQAFLSLLDRLWLLRAMLPRPAVWKVDDGMDDLAVPQVGRNAVFRSDQGCRASNRFWHRT